MYVTCETPFGEDGLVRLQISINSQTSIYGIYHQKALIIRLQHSVKPQWVRRKNLQHCLLKDIRWVPFETYIACGGLGNRV